MNRNNRILSAILIGSGLLWFLGRAGALPFNNQSTNQLNNPSENQFATTNTNQVAAAQDRPPVEDPNATRPGGSNSGSTGTQNFAPNGTSGTSDTTNPPGLSTDNTTGQSSQPIRAGW